MHTSVLERPIARNSSSNIIPLNNLLAIKPQLKVARVIILPPSLDNNLVPLSGLDSSNVIKADKVAMAIPANIRPIDKTSLQLVAADPDHGAWHVVIAAVVAARAVRNKLRNVVALLDKLPLFRHAKHEAVEALVAAVVAVVVVDFRVVAPVVVGVVRLRHLERCARLVLHVGHLVDGALVFAADIVPAVEGARVVKEAGCLGLAEEERQGCGDEGLDCDHCDCWLLDDGLCKSVSSGQLQAKVADFIVMRSSFTMYYYLPNLEKGDQIISPL